MYIQNITPVAALPVTAELLPQRLLAGWVRAVPPIATRLGMASAIEVLRQRPGRNPKEEVLR